MSDNAQNGGGGGQPAAPTAEQVEQLRLAFISQIAMDAKQLLGLVGFAVDDASISKMAELQFAAQHQLLQQIFPTMIGMARAQYPIFFVEFSRPGAGLIAVPGVPAAAKFAVGGPKRLNQDSAPGEIASTIAALGFLNNPALRVVVALLGLKMEFHQAPQPQPQRRVKM